MSVPFECHQLRHDLSAAAGSRQGLLELRPRWAAHLKTCPSCRADSFVLTAMADLSSQDELGDRRSIEAALDRWQAGEGTIGEMPAAAKPPGRWRLVGLVAAGLVAVGLVVVVSSTTQTTNETVDEIGLRPVVDGAESLTLVPGRSTGTEQSAAVAGAVTEMPGGVRTLLERNALSRVAQMDSELISIELTRGAMVVGVVPSERRPQVEIRTPHGLVTVVGTLFRVVVDADTTEVEVQKGTVKLSSGDGAQNLFVTAHHGAVLNGALTQVAIRAYPLSSRQRTALEAKVARLEMLTPEPAPAVAVEPARVTSKKAAVTRVQTEQVVTGQRPAKSLTPVGRRVESKTKLPSIDVLLARARRARASRQYQTAVDAYGKVLRAFPKEYQAVATQVSAGNLLLLYLNNPVGALAAYNVYLNSGFGPLAQQALAGKIKALRALHRYDDEQEAIGQFVSSYPQALQTPLLKERARVLAGK